MTQQVIILDDPSVVDLLNITNAKTNSKIFSLNFLTHKALEDRHINHEKAEDYISEQERIKVFDLTVSLHEWYNTLNFPDLHYYEINLLSMLDTNEFHSYVIHKLLQFVSIKNIIEKEKPTNVTTTHNCHSIVNSFIDANRISLLGENTLGDNLAWDKLSIIWNFGPIQIPINISRKTYHGIKNKLESLVCTFYGLWFVPNKNKQSILLLEFNPDAYSELFFYLGTIDKNIIIFNNRRSAVWNFKSIKILRNSRVKILNQNKVLDSQSKKEIRESLHHFHQKFIQLWENDSELSSIFVMENKSFWPAIKSMLKQTFENRLEEYLLLIKTTKVLFEQTNIKCILTLTDVGETEKAVLGINKNKKPSIMLEHYFANYTNETVRYDAIGNYHLIKGNIAVWGESQKKYLLQRNFPEKRIFVIGSPKHDFFFNKQKTTMLQKKEKTVLLTIHPITEVAGFGGTNMQIILEKFIRNFCQILNNYQNINLIVKLHPSSNEHHLILKKLFEEIDPSIQLYQTASIFDLINSCDVMVNISEFYSPSTVIMEAMILKKPILQIPLYGKQPNFEFVKNDAVLISHPDNVKENIQNILFDNNLRNKLIDNATKFLDTYLTNQGSASKELVKLLDNF